MAADTQINKASEKPSLGAKKEAVSRGVEESKEVRTIREAVGYEEAVETTGRVSEAVRKQAEQKGGGMAAGAAQAQVIDPAKIRENLLKNLPNERVMRRQIESEIKKEIKYLHKKAVKLMAIPNSMSFFEMANLMKKIRELKGILVKLVKSSLENLKTLWLRFVHGVM